MSRRLSVKVDPSAVSMAAAIRAAAAAAPLFVMTGRALADLARELGWMDAALRHLVGVAEQVERELGRARQRSETRTDWLAGIKQRLGLDGPEAG